MELKQSLVDGLMKHDLKLKDLLAPARGLHVHKHDADTVRRVLGVSDFNHDGKVNFAIFGNLIALGNGGGTFQNPADIVANRRRCERRRDSRHTALEVGYAQCLSGRRRRESNHATPFSIGTGPSTGSILIEIRMANRQPAEFQTSPL